MPLRFKLNLMTVGWCALGAFICAAIGNLLWALICAVLAYWNWFIYQSFEETCVRPEGKQGEEGE